MPDTEKRKARDKSYYLRHHDAVLARQKKYNEAHKDKIRAYRKTYNQTHSEAMVMANKKRVIDRAMQKMEVAQ